MYLYQLDKNFRSSRNSSFPVEINILDHKKEIAQLVKDIERYKLFNFNEKIRIEGKFIDKHMYSVAANIFFILNDSMDLTDEQKQFVLDIHDYKITWDDWKENKYIKIFNSTF